MGILTKLGQGQGYLKAGFMGFQKSGKTYTAIELAIGSKKHFNHEGSIAMFDTEGGSEYVAEKVMNETGQDLLGVKSRSFDDLMKVAQECENEGISVLVVDSVSHIWKELCDSYLEQVNVIRKKKGQYPRKNLEFQDWNPIKSKWAKWTEFYLNSKLHIIICGRAGYEYDYAVDEETGRKNLEKTGTKMKAENEFGFEPSLLVEMERNIVTDKEGKRIIHQATIIGDRFGVIDGKECKDPSFEFFLPHLEKLKPQAHSPIDTSMKTDHGVEEDGDAEWHREKKQRTIYLEEIQGEIVRVYSSQTKEDKQAKLDLIEKVFETRSWTKVENMNSQKLKEGLEKIREILSAPAKEAANTEEAA